MGNAKSSSGTTAAAPLDRKRTVNKRAGNKGKHEEGQSSWQPPGGLKSYTCVDTELPGAGDRGNGESERVVFVCVRVSVYVRGGIHS